MHYEFDQILDANPIRDVLQRLGVRIIRGSECRCPIHGDSTSVSGSIFYCEKAKREKFHCHGACDKSFDSIDLAKFAVGTDQMGPAIEWLTGKANGSTNGNGHAPNGKKRETPPPFDFTYFPPDQLAKLKIGIASPDMLTRTGGTLRSVVPALVHKYEDAKGVRLVVLRYIREDGEKSFYPVRWSPTRGLVSTSWQDGEDKLFYNHLELASRPDATVLVLEGERCVDTVKGLSAFTDEYVPITWQGGSPSAKYQPWEALRGRRLLFWPDADPVKRSDTPYGASEHAMRAAAAQCGAAVMQIVVPEAEWVERKRPPRPGKPAKHLGTDVADLLADEGMTAAHLRDKMEELAETIEGPEEAEASGPDKPDEPPEEMPGNADGSAVRWIPLTIVAEDGSRKDVIDRRDENNIWVQITELDGPRGYRGRFSRDVFTHDILLDGHPIDAQTGADMIAHEIALTRILKNVTPEKVRARIGGYADRFPVNALADELRALVWDNEPRHLLSYAGVDTSPGSWGRVAGWRWLLGLVRRILEPGCQHDGVLILEGPQGAEKTSFFRTVGHVLGRDLFVEVDKLTREPETLMILQGKAVVELAEMAALGRGDRNTIKSMISTRSDKYRRPYARAPEEIKRTCVFCGTTNDRRYLRDPTGNRRYWPVRVVSPMRLDGLAADLPQLLAQAVSYLLKPEPLYSQNWLTKEEEVMQAAIVKERVIEWPQFDKLDHFLDDVLTRSEPTVEPWEIWIGLGFTQPVHSPDLKSQLKLLMEERGWVYKQRHRYSGTPHPNRATWGKPPLDPAPE